MSEVTWAEAAAQMIAVVSRLNALAGEQQEWSTGVADGGPLADGRYPFTQPDGTVILVPCVAAIIVMVGNGLTKEGVAKLADGIPTDVTADFQVLGVAGDGTPKLFTPNLFAARRTVDLDVLPGDEYAEFIACLSSSGKERKLAVSYLTRQFGGVIDPTQPPYNVKYDYRKAKPAQFTAGSNLIGTDQATFTQADIGKMMVVGNATGNGALVGYIGGVPDAKHVYLFTSLAFTTPANATRGGQYEEMVWGTDGTIGMQRAFDDAEPVSRFAPGAVVLVGGFAMVTQLRFGSIAVVGLSTGGSGFVALPLAGSQEPVIADKNTGIYGAGKEKPQKYTLSNITIFGQRYTQFYSSYRRNLEVRGGGFNDFATSSGAPYAHITDVDLYDSQTDGGQFTGAYAGQFNNVRALFNTHCGLRMGFWDLNGQNWHVEANGCAGVFSFMPGANVSTVRASYNGADAGTSYFGGKVFPDEYGANWCEAGIGNIVNNARMQESWGHSLCITKTDPLNINNNQGAKLAMYQSVFDDTGNIAPAHGGKTDNLLGIRSMIKIKGNTCVNNIIKLVSGSGQVFTTNYATNGYADEGDPSGNKVELDTPGITNAATDWYSGAGKLAATSRGPFFTSSSSPISARNSVKINDQPAP